MKSSPEKVSEPLGQVLQIRSRLSGMSAVKLDNGPFETLTIHTRTEELGNLLAEDQRALREHLMSRKPGHFRTKARK